MTRTLWVALLGLLAGVLPAAGLAQDLPLFIPNDSWNGNVIGDPGRVEREFTFAVRGPGLGDFTNAALGTEIWQALAAAIGADSWQAPPLVGAFSSPSPAPSPLPVPYQQTNPNSRVFVDTYYETRGGDNYKLNAEYRFRMRFLTVDAIQGLQPQRLEYQSKFDRTPFVGGFSSVMESRLEIAGQSIAGSLNAYIRNAQSGLYNSAVMAPSSGLVDFYRRTTQPDPQLFYLPNLVLETDRSRGHLSMDLTNLGIPDVRVKEVLLTSMDTSRVYLGADYHRWLNREVAVKPDPLTVMNKVDVEFDRGASDPLDAAIAQALAAGDMTRFNRLTQVLNAFLTDQRTVMDTILARFSEISRQRGDANYLVCVAGVKNNYRNAFEAVFFIRGDANGDHQVDRADFAVIAGNFGLTSGALWSDGDFDGNGRVDLLDVAILRSNLGQSMMAPSAAAVPEPSTFALSAGAVALLVLRQLRRRP